MSAPFDYSDVSRRAERLDGELRTTGSYRDDTWCDPVLGPLVRVYALLTHRPNEAFDEPVTPEYLAECRTYAYVLLASIYDGLVGAATADDGFIDLATEYDALVSADLIAAMETAKADAKTRLAQFKASGVKSTAKRPGSVTKRRRSNH